MKTHEEHSRSHGEMPGIFVSYRREDMGPAAAPIAQLLKDHVAAEKVFFDRSDVPGGADWLEAIEAGIADRDALVALIGERWEGESESGRRIDDPDDVVRGEIRSSIAANLRHYPVLIDRSAFPDSLPDDIAALSSKNAAHLRQETFGYQFAAIVVRIWVDYLTDAGEHVVMTVGDVDLGAAKFLQYLGLPAGHDETMFVTRAAVRHGVIRSVELTAAMAPTLKLFIAEDASPEERQFGLALAALVPWTQIAVVSSTVATGTALAEASSEAGREWLLELAELAPETVDVIGVGQSWLAKAWSVVMARPRVSLVAGLVGVTSVGVGAAVVLSGDASVSIEGRASLVGAAADHALLHDARGLIAVPLDGQHAAWRLPELDGYSVRRDGLWLSSTVRASGEVVSHKDAAQLVRPGDEVDDVIEVVSLADRSVRRTSISELDVPYRRAVVTDDRIVASEGSSIWVGDLTDESEITIEVGPVPDRIIQDELEATVSSVEVIGLLREDTQVIAVAGFGLVDPIVREQRRARGDGWPTGFDAALVLIDLASGDVVSWGEPWGNDFDPDSTETAVQLAVVPNAYLSPDGSQVAVFRSPRIAVFDTATLALVADHSIAHNDFVRGNPWSPDGTQLVFEDSEVSGLAVCTLAVADGDVWCFEGTPFLLGDPIWDLERGDIVAVNNSSDELDSGVWLLDPAFGTFRRVLAFG